MTDKDPFSVNELFKAFSPGKIAGMFDPAALLSGFHPSGAAAADLRELMRTQQRNFDAMAAANAAAGAAYRALLERQMEIFRELTAAAAAELEAPGTTPEAGPRRAEAYAAAVERALGLMCELAAAVQRANEEVFETYRDRTAEIVAQMKGV